MAQYGWITLAQARTQLAARLADPSFVFWTQAELNIYITEALRVWNALTFTWKTTFTFTVAAASVPQWFSLATLAASPRLRSVTDTALYTVMEYHLLEPPSGGTWTGTTQFAVTDLATALQRCRDEAIQIANCNQAIITIAGAPGSRQIVLPDNVLDVSRVRWLPLNDTPVTLVRNDDTGFDFFQPGYLQEPDSAPSQYNIASIAPLTLQVDVAPVLEGFYELLVLQSGAALAPPSDTVLEVPNDFAWVLKWGALADLLGRESEATDRQRAQFCESRYTQGLQWLQATPFVMEAWINNQPVELISAAEMDFYQPEWDATPLSDTVVIAGTDSACVVPPTASPVAIQLTVLANAPVPTADADFIQCSRDVWDVILDYAQFLAAFKQGGAEFASAQPLEQSLYNAAIVTNGRLQKLGLFADVFTQKAGAEVRNQERFMATTGGQ